MRSPAKEQTNGISMVWWTMIHLKVGSSPVGWCIGDPSVWWLEGWFFSVL